MKILIPILITLLSFSVYAQDKDKEKREDLKKIYICDSKTSKRYHYKKDCKGLLKCTDTIVKITLKRARDVYGRTVCGFETHTETSSKYNN